MADPIKKSPVEHMHAELAAMLSRYELVADCVEGERKIKQETTKYLPKPNESDLSKENEIRYAQYVQRAVFYNVTGRSLSGMLGTVFQKAPEIEIPAALDVLKMDVDGGGVSLDQQSKKALSYVLQFGRAGILVDYPKTPGAVSVADLEAGKVRPNITLWRPSDVRNWRTAMVGGHRRLVLVVIAETSTKSDDGFENTLQIQYRVLRLENGVYTVVIWKPSADGKSYEAGETSIPTDGSGKTWPFIPFHFIGAENNDEVPDVPPLCDLASLNVAHYRNSADYEEACYMLGQPTPVFSGLTKDWVEEVLKGQVVLGSRSAVSLPVGGMAMLLQVQPNAMPKEAMEHKEKQMVALGAKLVEQRDVRQTATEASQNAASETSVLATSANNVSAAYVDALKWAGLFVSADVSGVVYKLNVEFEKRMASAQDRAQLVAEWQGNAITTSEMRAALKKIGVATLDDEDYKNEIEAAGPALGSPVKQAEIDAADAAAKAKAKSVPAV